LLLNRFFSEDFAGSHEPVEVNQNPTPKRGVTYIPACQLPNPRIDSAWTLVMRNKFSVSARFVESWASCAWSWAYKSKDER